ncbi:MAG: hypothetical protein PVF65_05400 [Sphingomonadales bacterium]|jgi:hypothetical protein
MMTYKQFLALFSALVLMSCGAEDTPQSVTPSPFEEGYKEGQAVYEKEVEPWKFQIVQSDTICAEQDALRDHGEAWLAAAEQYLACENPSRDENVVSQFAQARWDSRRIAERLSAFAIMGAEEVETVTAPALKSGALISVAHQSRVFESLALAMRDEEGPKPFFAWGAELQGEADVLESWAVDARALPWREEDGWQSPQLALVQTAQNLNALGDALMSLSGDAREGLARNIGFYLGQGEFLAARLKEGLSHISEEESQADIAQCVIDLSFDMHSVADLLSIMTDNLQDVHFSQGGASLVEDFLKNAPPVTAGFCEGP